MDNRQSHELMTIKAVCDEYGIGRTHLYEVLKRGDLSAKVVGKRGTRLLRGDVEAWIASLPKYRPGSPDVG